MPGIATVLRLCILNVHDHGFKQPFFRNRANLFMLIYLIVVKMMQCHIFLSVSTWNIKLSIIMGNFWLLRSKGRVLYYLVWVYVHRIIVIRVIHVVIVWTHFRVQKEQPLWAVITHQRLWVEIVWWGVVMLPTTTQVILKCQLLFTAKNWVFAPFMPGERGRPTIGPYQGYNHHTSPLCWCTMCLTFRQGKVKKEIILSQCT